MEILSILVAMVAPIFLITMLSLNPAAKEVEPIKSNEVKCIEKQELVYLGEFKLTGYCPCKICCGEYADGITATGTIAEEGRTIAVDPKIIPLGSKVMIDNHIYIAEDTGSAINENRIDIFKNHHEDCFSSDCNGYHDVYLIKE